ncbi:MAG: sterol desaturase family protein, partial [Verrucomicrobia bacterium]|nr:sterol desaturase family protein [Verrucomicrobiota bacterium]
MSLQDTRQKLRDELEAPASLRAFGTGWISGVAGLALGLIGLALVVSMRAPGQFAMPELTALHANPWFKLGILVLLLLGFAASVLSLALRPSKLLGTLGAAAALLATLLGGSNSTSLTPDPTPLFLGLDWFALNVLFTGIIFIPLERLSPLRAEQPLFRDEWREDIFYYLVSSFMVQVLAFVSFAPAKWVAAA